MECRNCGRCKLLYVLCQETKRGLQLLGKKKSRITAVSKNVPVIGSLK